jgi:hypothetical protein
MQQKPRTHEIVPNENISFPIGTIYAVEAVQWEWKMIGQTLSGTKPLHSNLPS